VNLQRYIRGMPRARTLVAALGTGVVLATGVGIAGATTGPNGTHVPRVLVQKSIGGHFTGRWTITKIEKRAKIAGGQVQIDYTITKVPYLFGTFQLQTYDANGRQTNFVANLYPFSYAGGKLRAKILSPGSNENLGSMAFDRPDADPASVLQGTLTFQGGTYAVSYKRTDAEAPIVGSSGTAADGSTSSSAPAPDAHPTKDGLGADDRDFYGRYALRSQEADAGASAGLYAPVVRVAAALVRGIPEAGSLTLADRGGAPVGTVSLQRPDATEVTYLTDFRWAGNRRTAIVRRSVGGEPVGTFSGTLKRGVLAGTLTVGRQRTAVRFERASN
jgi:hypothetical protein